MKFILDKAKRFFLYTLFIFVKSNLVFAQSDLQSLKFEYLTVENGLSNNRVQCIFRDRKSYLWIGTANGLNKYDGLKNVIYKHDVNNKNSLSDNSILCIFEDRTNNIWIGTTNGLNKFNPHTETFERYEKGALNTLSDNNITSIIEDKTGTIWVSTENGINKWNPEKDNFTSFFVPSKNNKTTVNMIGRIVFDVKGILWLATRDSCLWSFNPKIQQFKSYTEPNYSTSSRVIKDIVADSSGIIWIATRKLGLFSFNPTTEKFKLYNSTANGTGTNGNYILHLMLDGSKYLYIAVDQGGINRMDLQTKNFEYCLMSQKNKTSLNSDALWCLYKDNENILYAGTGTGGINIYNPKKDRFINYSHDANNLNSLIFNVIFKFYEDSKGLIWIGTDGGGLSIFDPKLKTFTNYQHNPKDPFSLSGNAVLSITEDKNHDMWIGTWGAGLNRFDRKTSKFHHYMPNPSDTRAISNQDIWDLFTDKKGNIWISCAFLGVDLFNIKEGVLKRYRQNISTTGLKISDHTNRIIQQGNGEIGLATNNGYFVIDTTTNSMRGVKGFNNYNLFDVYLDSKGTYWAVIVDKGILKLNPKGTIVKSDDTNGLLTNSVSGVLEDKFKNVWILTSSGLSEYNVQTNKYRHFTDLDGLQGKEFSRFALLKTKNGTIYIGGSNGFNLFNPEDIKINTYKPNIYIDQFQIFNETVKPGSANSPLKQSIIDTKEIILSYKQSVFSFSFIALNFTYPEKAQYAYKMDGYDKNWNYTDNNRRFATYTNLDAGDYTFMVKATNNDGIWNDNPTSIKITITPPFWKTWWFRSFIFILLIGSAAQFYLYRINKLKHQKNILEQMVDMRTKELKVANFSLLEKQDEILQQSEELLQQRNALSDYSQKLNLQHENIKSSVRYAQTIQQAILPSNEWLSERFESFIIYRPKDIVSGDFYWFVELKKYTNENYSKPPVLIAVVDCTGHGVPGAFMSMISNRILNEIVNERGITDPASILEVLDTEIQISLKQKNGGNNDGMDLSICLLEFKIDNSIHLTFAGAKNSLFYTDKNTNCIERLEGNHRNIGGYKAKKGDAFTNKKLVLDPNDLIYFTTDGYIDQNNNKRLRFGTKKFIEILNKNKNLSMLDQKLVLESELDEWQCNELQRDDITMVAIKL